MSTEYDSLLESNHNIGLFTVPGSGLHHAALAKGWRGAFVDEADNTSAFVVAPSELLEDVIADCRLLMY